jgi:hypothetical protein
VFTIYRIQRSRWTGLRSVIAINGAGTTLEQELGRASRAPDAQAAKQRQDYLRQQYEATIPASPRLTWRQRLTRFEASQDRGRPRQGHELMLQRATF